MNRREHDEAARRACAARRDSDREQIAEGRESGLRDALELLGGSHMTDTYDDIDISEIEAGLKRQEAEWARAYCAIMQRSCIGCSNVIWNDGNYCWRHGHKIADHMTESCVDFVALFPDDE